MNLEPIPRMRSNTWPMPRPEFHLDEASINAAEKTSNEETVKLVPLVGQISSDKTDLSSTRKKFSRRNAWGTESYADLITQAINNSINQRLTLSQVYDWMIENISFFKDKGDTDSSIGWKNSVRHNLSLHNRFIRVSNDDPRKSSWWMINPNAEFEKRTRRRATSIETGKFERKRERVRRNKEALTQNSIQPDMLSSPNHDNIKQTDFDSLSSQYATSNIQSCFRQRTSSYSSSYGKLSPIPSVNELGWTSQFNSNQEEVAKSMLNESIKLSSINQVTDDLPLHYDIIFSSNRFYKDNDEQFIASNGQKMSNIELSQAFYCQIHAFETCNCNTNVDLQNSNSIEVQNQNICDETYRNQYNLITSQTILLPIQKISENVCNEPQINNAVMNQSINAFGLVRNNSLLNDIDEIIKKEQNKIDTMQKDISTLYINNGHSYI